MGELIEYGKRAVEYGSYADFKRTMDTVVEEVEEGFVKIGYLLKVARDTAVLQESGYASVNEFAEKEYGLDKSAVSRFIAINDRFSENGYAPRLQEHYRGLGRAKLSIMLMLPDWINGEISPEYSKSDIQVIRGEVAAEEDTTDLEILMEEREEVYDRLENDLQRVVWKLGKDMPELYRKLWKAYMDTPDTGRMAAAVMEIMAPAGEGIHSARIPGTGRMMLSLKGADRNMVLINVRSGEKQEYGWADMEAAFDLLMGRDSAEESWETVYGEKIPEIAPVQQESRKTTRVSPAVTEGNSPEGNGAAGSRAAAGEPEGGAPDGTDLGETGTEPEENGTGQQENGTEPEETGTEVPEEIGRERLPRGEARKKDSVTWKEPERKEPHPIELPPEDAVYTYPMGTNMMTDIRKGQRFLILRTQDPYRVGNTVCLQHQKDGEQTGAEIHIRITHLINDHGGLVPGYAALQFDILPAPPEEIPGQMSIGQMEGTGESEEDEKESKKEADASSGIHGESEESGT